ncbi:hypothetical protein [Arthrobacter roseus]|uniref:hypothetical protein n=1 Tax=Arthrobacter roseus TaxID=136274 RepID=UPI001962A8E3|nr:hypothetical protein [Arthrobacter roseus]MBM7847945.1 hypothetical protein [Arthrobacter roseus]
MRSLGIPENTANKPTRGVSLKAGTIGMTIMLVVFLVALVFAANENDVVGWLVVIVSLGWLLVFSFVVFSLRSAAKKASAKFDEAQNSFNRAAGRGPLNPASGSTAMRDQKLDHSFKIIQVQAKVVRDYQDRDQAMVDRALETIEITAHNARGMMKTPNDDGPVQGTVVNE